VEIAVVQVQVHHPELRRVARVEAHPNRPSR